MWSRKETQLAEIEGRLGATVGELEKTKRDLMDAVILVRAAREKTTDSRA